MFCYRLLTSLKFNIFHKKIRNTIKVLNGPENRLDSESDRDRDCGGPDLGPN